MRFTFCLAKPPGEACPFYDGWLCEKREATQEEAPEMPFHVTHKTTPEQAIDMAYELGTSLRATGWPRSREQYARDLWVEYEFGNDPLRPFLDAGFTAGYIGDRKPSPKDLN